MTSCSKVDNSVVFSHNDYSNDVSWFFRTLEAVQVAHCVISVSYQWLSSDLKWLSVLMALDDWMLLEDYISEERAWITLKLEAASCNIFTVFLSTWCYIQKHLTLHQDCCETCDSDMEVSYYRDFLNHLLQVVDATRVLAERRNVGKVLLKVETTSREWALEQKHISISGVIGIP